MKHNQAKRVNFLANPDDLEVLVLARLGQTSNSISERVRLTPSQVQYRVIHGGAKYARRDFRNGLSFEFNLCFSAVRKQVQNHELNRIKQELAKHLDRG